MNRCFRVPAILVLCWSCAAASTAVGKDRKGTLEDASGKKIELTKIKADGLVVEPRFYGASSRRLISVLNEPFQTAINVDELKSIKAKGEVFEISYVVSGKEKTITGPLAYREFTGESSGVQVKFSTKGLQELILTDAPGIGPGNVDKTRDEELKTNLATLVLQDGSLVAVRGLRRVASYYSTKGFIQGGTTIHHHAADFLFVPNKPLEAIDFAKIKSIEFIDKDTLRMTYRAGESETRTISKETDARIDGFSGVNDDGDFYIASSFIKKIEFAPPPLKKKPMKVK